MHRRMSLNLQVLLASAAATAACIKRVFAAVKRENLNF